MNILLAGDLAPTSSNMDLFKTADIEALLGNKLSSLWNSADIKIFNLEVPLTNREEPINKCGPHLIAPLSAINGIIALNPSLVTLANNHILDQGEAGLRSTRDILKQNNIPYIGAGENISEASAPFILQKDEKKIGVYACAEHEFSIVGEKAPGANPFDPLESLDHLQSLKAQCDYVIVLYHGGKEHYRYPSPDLQKVCRKMAERGADLIVCQHSHCIGCVENYKGAVIVYGQGNFIFDNADIPCWQTSLLIKVEIKAGLEIEYIPIVKKGNTVTLAAAAAADEIMAAFYKRSDEIMETGFIERQYQQYARENTDYYMRNFAGHGKWLSRIDKYLLKGHFLKQYLNKKQKLKIQNYLACEAHRELALACLKENDDGK